MSGHSKWATIKRKKEKTDAAKGKVFTKIVRELAVAVKRRRWPRPKHEPQTTRYHRKSQGQQYAQ